MIREYNKKRLMTPGYGFSSSDVLDTKFQDL
jgi:hypothetical protein